jgi:DNA-binding beta-propeller fold protein YncE
MTRRSNTFIVSAAGALLVASVVVGVLLWPRRAIAPTPLRVAWLSVVTNLAGVGAPGMLEGLGVAAAFADPFGIAVDATGNTWVTDGGDNNVIWRIDPEGNASIVAGGCEGMSDGQGRAACFDSPSAAAFDPQGNLVVADTANHAIRRVARDGRVTTIAGSGEPGDVDGAGREARFDGPIGVAVAPDGRVIVADTYNDRIRQIETDGRVVTIAGHHAGYRDGPAADALFDTPSGVAVDHAGNLYVADTGNDMVRRISRDGQVTTLASALARPVGIAVDEPWQRTKRFPNVNDAPPKGMPDPGFVDLYITDAAGRLLFMAASGDNPAVLSTGTVDTRFRNPSGVALAPDGSLRIADSDNYLVRRVTRPDRPARLGDIDLTPVPALNVSTLRLTSFPWPLDPQDRRHEVAATLGEARGSPGGDGRERLHTGVDVRGPAGAIVRAVRDEKVQRPVAATGFSGLNESLRVGVVSYVHVRVGRTPRGRPLDPSRFAILLDETGRPTRVRVRRGTRFHVGDAIGTINAFAHVHLGVGPSGAEINALALPLPDFADHVAPTIAAVELYGESGERLGELTQTSKVGRQAGRRKSAQGLTQPSAGRRQKEPSREPIPVWGRVSIVVEAFDRVDGNGPTRRLGVYALGYQVLHADGTPVNGFAQPLTTIEFDRLSGDPEAPQMIYAEGSGITVYGNRTTRFRYIVTNSLHEGRAARDTWDTAALPPGAYRLRVFASDRAGNRTEREVRVVR